MEKRNEGCQKTVNGCDHSIYQDEIDEQSTRQRKMIAAFRGFSCQISPITAASAAAKCGTSYIIFNKNFMLLADLKSSIQLPPITVATSKKCTHNNWNEWKYIGICLYKDNWCHASAVISSFRRKNPFQTAEQQISILTQNTSCFHKDERRTTIIWPASLHIAVLDSSRQWTPPFRCFIIILLV